MFFFLLSYKMYYGRHQIWSKMVKKNPLTDRHLSQNTWFWTAKNWTAPGKLINPTILKKDVNRWSWTKMYISHFSSLCSPRRAMGFWYMIDKNKKLRPENTVMKVAWIQSKTGFTHTVEKLASLAGFWLTRALKIMCNQPIQFAHNLAGLSWSEVAHLKTTNMT